MTEFQRCVQETLQRVSPHLIARHCEVMKSTVDHWLCGKTVPPEEMVPIFMRTMKKL